MKTSLFTIINAIIVICSSAQIKPDVIFTKTEKDVIPEGITINPADKTIYVSSIPLKKIIAIDTSGRHKDFIKTNQDEFLEGLGMKIDKKTMVVGGVESKKR